MKMRLIDADALRKQLAIIAIDNFSIADDYQRFIDALKCADDEIENAPTVDAVPVSFINEMIKRFRDIADYAFDENGGYFDSSHYELWALEMLLTEWRESIAERKEDAK